MCEKCSAEQQTQCFDKCMDDDLGAMLKDWKESPEDVPGEKIKRCLGLLAGLDFEASRGEL